MNMEHCGMIPTGETEMSMEQWWNDTDRETEMIMKHWWKDTDRGN